MSVEYPLKLRVGVVEDEPRLRELLVREIGAMGHDAWGVPMAEQAWPRIDGNLDAVILDLNLPGMAGIELFRRIRKQESQVAVVILTGFGSLDSAVQSVRWKAEDYLTKPCSLADIDQALSRILARKRESNRSTRLNESVEEEVGMLVEPAIPPADSGTTLADMERDRIIEALHRHRGNKPAVAVELGISLRTLYNRVNTYRSEGINL